MTRIVSAIAALLLSALFAGDAFAARMALVIGNAAYQNTGELANPKRDAVAFAKFLEDTGFTVTVLSDATRAQMSAAIVKFSQTLRPEDSALFYYSGHGMQMGGENYLIGVEALLQNEFDVPGEAIGLNGVIELLETKAHISMIFVDACRNNPLAENLARDSTRSGITRGLAPIQAEGDGTMVAFAAAPGQVAFDGIDENSPFTTALISHLAEPGLEVGTAFKRVIRDVRTATLNRQSPQLVSSLASEFYFSEDVDVAEVPETPVVPQPTPLPQPEPAPGPISIPVLVAPEVLQPEPVSPEPAPEPPAVNVAEVDFGKAKTLGSRRGWQLFLRKYPDDALAGDAKLALAKMATAERAAAGLTPKQLEDELTLDRDTRVEIQRAVNAKGFDLGKPDGAFGPASRAAIAAFQRDAGVPDTGFVTVHTIALLGIPLVLDRVDPVSGNAARRYDVAGLTGLESSTKLLGAIECLSGRQIVYGGFEDHLYVAVVDGDGDFAELQAVAERCGGNLVSLETKEENDFVFAMIRDEPRFFNVQLGDDETQIHGPIIGLSQAADGKEPGSKWRWASGAELDYAAWGKSQPDDFKAAEDIAAYMWIGKRLAGSAEAFQALKPTWGDSLDGGSTGFIIEIE